MMGLAFDPGAHAGLQRGMLRFERAGRQQRAVLEGQDQRLVGGQRDEHGVELDDDGAGAGDRRLHSAAIMHQTAAHDSPAHPHRRPDLCPRDGVVPAKRCRDAHLRRCGGELSHATFFAFPAGKVPKGRKGVMRPLFRAATDMGAKTPPGAARHLPPQTREGMNAAATRHMREPCDVRTGELSR